MEQPADAAPLAAASRDEWRAQRAEFLAHVDTWVAPRLARRAQGHKHPVDDFLWEYYSISPGKLRTWHPGRAIEGYESDLALLVAGAYEWADGVIRLSPAWLENNADAVRTSHELLTATASRPARGGCFGLHEWAMVLGTDDVRHSQHPLRVTQDQIRATIDDVGLRCTHFDAFRFFTPEATPKNPLQLTRSLQMVHEQPGCLHANMDLYKHAVRLAPLVGSDAVLRAFALARDIREVDMRAAPYDLSSIGVVALAIETESGRSEFAHLQQTFAARAAQIRTEILGKTGAAVAIG
jgi:hypothetical protein